MSTQMLCIVIVAVLAIGMFSSPPPPPRPAPRSAAVQHEEPLQFCSLAPNGGVSEFGVFEDLGISEEYKSSLLNFVLVLGSLQTIACMMS